MIFFSKTNSSCDIFCKIFSSFWYHCIMTYAILTIFDYQKTQPAVIFFPNSMVHRNPYYMDHILWLRSYGFYSGEKSRLEYWDSNLTIISVPSNFEASLTLVEVIFATKKFLKSIISKGHESWPFCLTGQIKWPWANLGDIVLFHVEHGRSYSKS